MIVIIVSVHHWNSFDSSKPAMSEYKLHEHEAVKTMEILTAIIRNR